MKFSRSGDNPIVAATIIMSGKSGKISIKSSQLFFACLFFASLNFEVFSPFVENFSVAKMAALFYITVSLFTPKMLFSYRGIKLPLFSIIASYAVMVFSSIIHMRSNHSIFDTTIFLNIIMFWLLLNHSRRDARVFREGLLWFAISGFIVGILYYFGVGVSVGGDMRVTIFGDNSNGVGFKMATAILFLINYCLFHSTERPIYRPWLLVMIAPMITLLFATASRLSILILGSGLILFILIRPAKKRMRKLLWILLGTIFLYYGYRVVLRQEVLMSRMERTIDEGNISGRDDIWSNYLVFIEQHPILGVGFTGSDRFAMEVFGRAMSPHNVFIEVALYSGIVGLILFTVFIISVFKDAWLYYRNRGELGPLITSMAIIGMLMSGQALGVKLFWSLAAYAISYRVIKKDSLPIGTDMEDTRVACHKLDNNMQSNLL